MSMVRAASSAAGQVPSDSSMSVECLEALAPINARVRGVGAPRSSAWPITSAIEDLANSDVSDSNPEVGLIDGGACALRFGPQRSVARP